MEHDNLNPVRHSKSSSKRELYRNRILPQETRKISNKQSSLHLKELEKGQNTPKLVEGAKS